MEESEKASLKVLRALVKIAKKEKIEQLSMLGISIKFDPQAFQDKDAKIERVYTQEELLKLAEKEQEDLLYYST